MKTQLLAQALNFYDEATSQNLPGVPAGVSSSADRGFGSLLGSIMSGVMTIAALLVLLYLIWGAIEWITSGGDKGKTESARNKITTAIIGLIVLAATTAIFMLLQRFLGIEVLNFEAVRSGSVINSPK